MSVRDKFYEELAKSLDKKWGYNVKHTKLKEMIGDNITIEENKVICKLNDGKAIQSKDPKLINLAKMTKLKNIPLTYMLTEVVKEPRSSILKRLWGIHIYYEGKFTPYEDFAASRKNVDRVRLSRELEDLNRKYNVGDDLYLFLDTIDFIRKTKRSRYTPDERIRTTDELLSGFASRSNKNQI